MANIIKRRHSSEEEKLLYDAYTNLIAFGKLFLPGDFTKNKTPEFHFEVAEELSSKSNKPCAIILPRGFGKTTLIKCKILHDFCFSKKAREWGFTDEEHRLFYGWVSSSQRKSINNVAYIKLHLEHNQTIKYYFGNLRGRSWNLEDIVTANGDRLMSSSNLMSLRGDTQATIEEGSIRFNCVFVDDAENEENTRTINARNKIKDVIMNGILPAIEKTIPGNRLFVIGTPVHYDSFVQNVLDKYRKYKADGREDEYTWKVITYPAILPDGTPLWEDRFPLEVLENIKKEYVDSPRGIGGYYQEYLLQVQSSETALWTPAHLKYWEGYFTIENDIKFLVLRKDGTEMKVPVNTFIGCDPATDIATKTSDYSVIIVIAVDSVNNVYVLDYVRERGIPTLGLKDSDGNLAPGARKGVVDYIFEMAEKYQVDSITVEDVPMNRSVLNDYMAECRRRNNFQYPLIPAKPGGKEKLNRIYTLLNNRFASGAIYIRDTMFELENEILTFGDKMAHDDTIDALAYACMNAYPSSLTVSAGEKSGETMVRSKHNHKRRFNWKIL